MIAPYSHELPRGDINPPKSKHLRNLLAVKMKERRFTISTLAIKSGVTYHQIYPFMNGHKDIKAAVLIKILKVLTNISLEDLKDADL